VDSNVEIPAGSIQSELSQALLRTLGDVQDFPIDGIQFKDIAPVLGQRGVLSGVASALAPHISPLDIETVMAIDARGFVFGAVLADRLEASFVMVRKPGKLPGDVHSFDYTCEYCSGQLEVSVGLVLPGMRVLIVDDVLATGGTARATADFATRQGAAVSGFAFLLEIGALRGRERLHEAPVLTMLRC
jgi:adenine phosphoribosyltransferase